MTKGKGWRYDFTLAGIRHTGTWFKTKTEAKTAESKRREELAKPEQETVPPIDMGFLALLNKKLDHIKVYKSAAYYFSHVYSALKWVKKWKDLSVAQIKPELIEAYLINRAEKVSPYTANSELRCLRALFNFGCHPRKGWITSNPTAGVRYFRFHALRHLGASMLERAHAPVGDIQRLLGHENRTTTEIYLHSIGELERKAMSLFDSEMRADSHTESHTNFSHR